MIKINIIWKAKSVYESQIQNRTKTSSFLLHNTQKVQLSQWTTQFWTVWFNMEENEVLQLEPPSHAKVKKMYMVFHSSCLLSITDSHLLDCAKQGLFYIISVELWLTSETGLMSNRQKFDRSKWKSDFWNHLTTFITDMKVSFWCHCFMWWAAMFCFTCFKNDKSVLPDSIWLIIPKNARG